MDSFAKFLSVNGLKKKDIAAYLGVSNAFITQLCAGTRKLPADKYTLIKANPDWDSSMLLSDTEKAKAIHLDHLDRGRSYEATPEQVREVIEKALVPEEHPLVAHLQRKVDNQERLIRELYKEIGMLEAKLELARKGETASTATGSSAADVG
jgi:hypothetical protein